MPRMEGTILHAILAPSKKDGSKPKATAPQGTGPRPPVQPAQ
jgi:hypothetical protein